MGILSLCLTVHGSRKDAWCTKPPGSRVSGLSGSGCKFLRSLRLGGRDEHVGRQMALLKFQKGRTRTSDRQTAHVGLSNFTLTHEGKPFAGLSAYVPKLKGRKYVLAEYRRSSRPRWFEWHIHRHAGVRHPGEQPDLEPCVRA